MWQSKKYPLYLVGDVGASIHHMTCISPALLGDIYANVYDGLLGINLGGLYMLEAPAPAWDEPVPDLVLLHTWRWSDYTVRKFLRDTIDADNIEVDKLRANCPWHISKQRGQNARK